MNDRSGYFLIYRSVFNHYLFEGDKFSKRDAWIWLLAKASYQPNKMLHKNKIVTVERGQVPTSFRKLAEKWGWSANTVRGYLQLLKNDGMIDTQVDAGFLVITICNYNDYQLTENNNMQTTDTHPDTQVDTLPDTVTDTLPDTNINKGKEYKERTNTNADAREPVTKCHQLKLEDLSYEHIEPWLLQQEVRASPITIDVRGELERFKTHFLSYGGKDKNGNSISDWVAKLGSWILNEQKQQKFGGKNEQVIGKNTRTIDRSEGGLQVARGIKTKRTDDAFSAIIAQRNAEWESRGFSSENPGLLDFPE